MLDEIITQLKAEVADFENRVDTAAQLAALVRSGNLPNRTPCAYVVPLGFTTEPQKSAAGMFIQSIKPRVGVVIAVNTAGDASGAKSLPEIETLSDDVIAALAGWQPASAKDGLQIVKGQLVSLTRGLILYQLDFSITDQVRIAR